ncbi:MAG: hypothetical protein UY92_C0009G0079 [Candidatus Magasanikbacteria bacterium GW2011_GWA2_56_11]|uniref:SbsA Ig-like domain-containing protein n=1 Tax=Candidatus Magasanikbacteria bacterium GW2011_GWA2_56_11 TaxID=1619044 RepID=A0A0G1YGF5_9BACT|nr:MAG: hypothetical protein UY92_C0009G0079 [Candidatus Magasanikbacteria bacterium GW2011_GWA2_56_11]
MIILVVTVFVFLALPSGPLAAQTDTFGVGEVDQVVQLGNDDIRVIIARIIRAALGLLGAIAVGIIIYAGFVIMTAGGNEEKVITGRKILINATIGLAIILAALTIVHFVFKSLQDGILGADDSGGTKPVFETFSGSGALGSIIKDHYPEPNQTKVPRNTKIAVTFAEPVRPESFIVNANSTCWPKEGTKPLALSDPACQTYADGELKGKPVPFYGDCVDLNNDKGISWETECDRIATSTVQIYKTEFAQDPDKPLFEAAAVAVYDQDKTAALFTFRPLELLGDSAADVWHHVRLVGGNKPALGIKRSDGSDIFPAGKAEQFYEWKFATDTTIDFTPPTVADTYPASGAVVARNTIVQITFSEPVDPAVAQGLSGADSDFSHLIFSYPDVSGEWRITNGYRTVEFVSDKPCGQNSCGETMYCLAVACQEGQTGCQSAYTGLVRTAELLEPAQKNFIAAPFSGLMDMAGNALDSGGPNNGGDGVPANPHKPAVDEPLKIGAGEQAPDNYWWSFTVENKIDRSAPLLATVEPVIDQEGVKGPQSVGMGFNKIMWLSTLVDGVKIEEYPGQIQGLSALPYYHRSAAVADKTLLQLKPGRDLGPNGLDLYYFTSVSSSVRSANQNCLYPGRGPAAAGLECVYAEDDNGVVLKNENCAAVTLDTSTDTGCASLDAALDQRQADVPSCLKKLREASPTALK